MKKSLLPITLALLALTLLGVEEKTPGVYVILDGSGSMWGQLPDGSHKISAAREVLEHFQATDYAGQELAFRVYGHRREGDCSDSELVVGFSAPGEAISRMTAFARSVNPKGKTPISRSLRAALEDFGDRPGEIILVSDGIETCDEDPCALVQAWRDSNVAIRVHVVGLGLEERERAAMACISKAAGTEFHDAQSADELAAGLARIQQGSKPESAAVSSEWQVLDILAVNAAGERMRVSGTAVGESGEPIPVSSGSHNRVPPGTYQVTVGVQTRNGNLFQPVTQAAAVATAGASEMRVVVPEPPSVRAKFIEGGETARGSFVTAYQGEDEAFGFRSMDRAYLDPGTYHFRAKPNADNELEVTETFADGDHKEIVFQLVHTVHALIKMVATDSGKDFRANYELWQDGERKYKVHQNNGVRALPGTYDLHLPLSLTPYVHQGLTLTTEPKQKFRIEVPVGHVTVRYQKADGSAWEKEERCSVQRIEGEKYLRGKNKSSGQRIPLVAGKYRVQGWSHLGSFDDVYFEIRVGNEREVILREKGEG